MIVVEMKFLNFIDLIADSLEKKIINEDEYDLLIEIFWNYDEYQFTNFVHKNQIFLNDNNFQYSKFFNSSSH